MTQDVLANRLCKALKFIDGFQKMIVKFKNSYDQLDKASMINYNETVERATELEHVKGKAATEEADRQCEVVTLQCD